MATKKGMLRTTSRPAYSGLRKKRRNTTPAFRKLETDKLRIQARYKKLREKTKQAPSKIAATVCTTSGGAAAGASNVFFPSIMGIPTSALIGSALVAYSFFDESKLGNGAACIGAGMLSAFAADFIQTGLESGIWNPILDDAVNG